MLGPAGRLGTPGIFARSGVRSCINKAYVFE